jgi:hypothetical protein
VGLARDATSNVDETFMSHYTRNIWIGASVVLTLFMGLFVYAGRLGPQMNAEASAALSEFFARLQRRDYPGAHTLASAQLANDLTPTKLVSRAQKRESVQGPIQGWGPTTGGDQTQNIGRVCVFPPFVDFYTSVRGTKGYTVYFTRLKPENGRWRIDRWSELNVQKPRRREKK